MSRASAATLRIYRTLLRQSGAVRRRDVPLSLAQPIDIGQLGHCRFGGNGVAGTEDEWKSAISRQPPPIIPGRLGELLSREEACFARDLLPRAEWPLAPALAGAECEALIKRLFRSASLALRRTESAAESAIAFGAYDVVAVNEATAAAERAKAEDMAFSALRIMNGLAAQWQRSSAAESGGVRVLLDHIYLQANEAGDDVYAYRLLVENRREHNGVQVLGRHWRFEDSNGELVNEVPRWSAGVVGLRPHLPPGQWVEYVSGTTLRGGCDGAMQGAMLMVDDSGENVEAEVARLELTKEPLEGPTPLYYDDHHRRRRQQQQQQR